MLFKYKKPIYFKLVLMLSATVYLFFIIFGFYRSATIVSDENYFTRTPANIYFNTNINSVPFINTNFLYNVNLDETGHLLLKVNNKKVASIKQVMNLIRNEKDTVIFCLYNPQKALEYTAKVLPKDLPGDFLAEIKFGALITQVIKEGASDRAGLREGDIIISINDKSFENIFEADKYMRSYSAGTSIKYTVLRNGVLLDFSVRLAKFGVPFNLLLLFCYSIIIIGFGLFLGLSRSKLLVARFVSFLLLMFGFVNNGQVSTFPSDWFEVVKLIIFSLTIYNIFPLMFHTNVYFPYENTDLKNHKWIIRFPYIVSVITMLIMRMQLFYYSPSLSMEYLVVFYLLFMLLYYVITIAIFNRTNENESSKAKAWVTMANLFLIFIFILLTSRTLVIDYAMQYFGWYDIIDRICVILYISIPTIYFFVIVGNHLLDVRFRIRRNIQYYLVNGIWQAAIIAFVIFIIWFLAKFDFNIPNFHITGSGIEVLDAPLNYELQFQYEKLMFVIISIGIVIFFLKFRKSIQQKLNVKYHRSGFDYRKASTELTEILAKNLTVKELAKNIINELVDLIHLKRTGIIIFKNEERVFEQEFFGFKSDNLREVCQATGYKFADSIKEFKSEFRIEYLPEPLKSVFKEFEFTFIVPVRAKEKIVAALLLGEKMSEMAFRREDFEFLSSVSGQIAVSIENGFLIEELASQERIKHELEIARRIQLASLPQTTPQMEGLDISGASIPALEVGGDFYDYLEGIDSSLTIIIGDVSGKGTSAALYMSKIQGIIRTLHEFDLSPRKLLISANQLLNKYLEKSYFITAIGAQISTRTNSITIARAGHLPLYYYNHSIQKIEKIISKGMALGFSKDSLFDRNLEEIEIKFHSGDVFVFVTDGVIEARNPLNIEFGDDKLIGLIERNNLKSSEDIRNSIIESVTIHSANVDQYDDLTVVVIKIQ